MNAYTHPNKSHCDERLDATDICETHTAGITSKMGFSYPFSKCFPAALRHTLCVDSDSGQDGQLSFSIT